MNTPNRLILTKRDRELLTELFWNRAMTRNHLLRLGFFPSVSRCNTRLRQLIAHGLVRSHESLLYAHGSNRVFGIGTGATSLVSEACEAALNEVRRVASDALSPLSLEHTLRLVDLKVAFLTTGEYAGINVETWLAEAQCRHQYSVRQRDGSWREHILKPDALGFLHVSGREHGLFLELDLGNVSQEKFAAKIASYERYAEHGMFERTYELPSFQVLTLTTSETRLRNLMALVKSGSPVRFRFTTHEEARKATLFGAMWREPNIPEPQPLVADSEVRS